MAKEKNKNKAEKPKLAMRPLDKKAPGKPLKKSAKKSVEATTVPDDTPEDPLNSLPFEAQITPEKNNQVVNKTTHDTGSYDHIEN